MRVTFWGVRGSIPAPGPETNRYGGNTACVSLKTRRDIDGVLGWLYSTSYASLHVLGDKREAFERDLREALLFINPDGWFEEEVKVEGIFAWKENA